MNTRVMKAVLAATSGSVFVPSEIKVPEPGMGQVRIKVHACGVCAGEYFARNGLMGTNLPRVPGHEISGTIDAVGAGVTAWSPGDRVGVGWHGGSCFTCEYCRQGDFVNCVNRKITGISYDGGYAEYMVAPQDALARVPDSMSLEEAGPMMCAGITTFNALRHSGAKPGETVAIHGIGGLGHLAIQFADKMGFRTIAINRGRAKEKLARKLGVDGYIDSEAGSVGEAVRRVGGASVIFSTVASSVAHADMTQGLRPNGRLIFVAVDHRPLEVSPGLLVSGRRSVAGWASGTAKDSEEAMAFAALKKVKVSVELQPLDRAEEAFQNMKDARFRTVLVP
jgi:propanol-preferring alcohol dehydrogenase